MSLFLMQIFIFPLLCRGADTVTYFTKISPAHPASIDLGNLLCEPPVHTINKRGQERESPRFLRWSEVFLAARLPQLERDRRDRWGGEQGKSTAGTPTGAGQVRASPGISQKGRATSRVGNPAFPALFPLSLNQTRSSAGGMKKRSVNNVKTNKLIFPF